MEAKYTCLIVDEDSHAHDVIKALLLCYPSVKFMKSCYNKEEAIREINTHQYDIVFLNVKMPNLNGIDIIGKLNKKPTIIITSTVASFAFEAYENGAVDYLKKPILKGRFGRAIKKALLYSKEKRKENKKYLILKIDGLPTKINQDEILYIRSMVNHSKYYLQNRIKPVLINEAFSKQLLKLNTETFLQTHRTCIVNKKYITGKKDNELILSSNTFLPIGRKYLSEIQSLLIQLE